MPEMSDDKVMEISGRYQELYEQFTGEPLKKENSKPINERIQENILNWIRNQE
jgi:phosphoribosylaminoimidazole-succinocarboxamide synthase